MEKKILFLIFSIALISIGPHVYAQEDLGTMIEEQKIIFEVGKHADVHVKHVIETGMWNSDRPRIIEILPGPHSNLIVTDEDGDKLSFSYDNETFEKSKFIILNQKLGNYDLIAEYDLDNFMELKDGLWTKGIDYSFDVVIMVEDELDLIFTNSRPVDLSDAKGINCIGCNLLLEYFDNEKNITREISTSDDKFRIEIVSNEEVFDLEFIEGGSQLLNFNVKDIDQLFVLKIPFENFLNPYNVYFTEKDDTSLDQTDKIRKTEFSQDETHVNLSFRTNGEGTISIIGATPEEYQKKLEQIKSMKANEVESKIVEKEKGLALPIPGTKAASELESQFTQPNEEKVDELSFANELKYQTQNSDNSMTIVGIIVGLIIVGIISGVIFKLKKN